MPFLRTQLQVEVLNNRVPRYTRCTLCHQPQDPRRSEQSVCQACLDYHAHKPAPPRRPAYGRQR